MILYYSIYKEINLSWVSICFFCGVLQCIFKYTMPEHEAVRTVILKTNQLLICGWKNEKWAIEKNLPRRLVGGWSCWGRVCRDGDGRVASRTAGEKLVFIISEMYGCLATCGPVAAMPWGAVCDRLQGLWSNLLRSSLGGYYCYMALRRTLALYICKYAFPYSSLPLCSAS